MSRILLIARREYLSYVATWGFWISLALVPVFMFVGAVVPALIANASPSRYFVVIADDPALDAAIDERLAEAAERRERQAIEVFAATAGLDQAKIDQGLAAFDAAPAGKAEAALTEMGLPTSSLKSLGLRRERFVRAPTPSRDVEALRPYLRGEAQIDTADGPVALDAAIVLRRTEDSVAIDYWSARLTDTELKDLAERAVREAMRDEALQARGVSPQALNQIDRLRPIVEQFTPAREVSTAKVTTIDRLPFALGVGLGFGLWVVIFSVINMLLTSVIEEKSNKILETLLTSARIHEILIGKLLGVAFVSLTLIGVWGAAAGGALAIAAQAGSGLPEGAAEILLDWGLWGPAIIYFAAGYLMYGALFLAIGSLCETIQEAQTLLSPMILVLMGPMLVLPAAIRDPEAPIVQVLSWAPIYTPFLMLMRLPTKPDMIEVVGTTAVMLITTALIVWGAGALFGAGVAGRLDMSRVKSVFANAFRLGRKAKA